MSNETISTGFYVAPFDVEGEPVGVSFWKYTELSADWNQVFAIHIMKYGMVSDVSMEGPLSHFRIKCTSASGAAIVTVFCYKSIGASILLLSGLSNQADTQIAKMFVDSIRRSNPIPMGEGFDQVLQIRDRPLMVVIQWTPETTPEADSEMTREISLHFASAFFSLLNKAEKIQA